MSNWPPLLGGSPSLAPTSDSYHTHVWADITGEAGDLEGVGDLRSYNWDGGADLSSSYDSTATAGYFVDASEGSAQFMGSVWFGGYFQLLDGVNWWTRPTSTEHQMRISNTDAGGGKITWYYWDGAVLNAATTFSQNASGVFTIDGSEPMIIQVNATNMLRLTGSPAAVRIAAPLVGDTDTDTKIDLGYTTADTISIHAGNAEMLRLVESTNDQVYIPFDGAAAAPALAIGALDVGFYRTSGDQLSVVTEGTARFRWDTAGDFRSENGTGAARLAVAVGDAAGPAFNFVGDTDTGMYRDSANVLGFATAGTARLVMSSGSLTFEGNGVWRSGTQSGTVNHSHYNGTTGSAANAVVSTGTGWLVSTSALKYKSQVSRDVDYLADLELVPTKHWRLDDERWRYGFIADWLGDQDPLLATYDEDGEVISFDLAAVLAVMAAKINRLEESD